MRRALASSSPARVLGVGLRIWAWLLPQGALDADEAVVGLLTRGILHGTFPAFFPGQGYGGTQEEWLAAPLVAVFGLHAWTIRAAGHRAVGASRRSSSGASGCGCSTPRRAVAAALVFWLWPTYFVWKSSARTASTGPSSSSACSCSCSCCGSRERVTRARPRAARARARLRPLVEPAGRDRRAARRSAGSSGRAATSCAASRSCSRPAVVGGAAVAARQPAARLVLAPSRQERGAVDRAPAQPRRRDAPAGARRCASRGRSSGSARRSSRSPSTPPRSPASSGCSCAGRRGLRRCS